MAPMRLPHGKDADAFTVHRRDRLAVETDRERIGRTPITPVSELFVLQHHEVAPYTTPADAWTVRVEGVRRPATLTVAELRELGSVRVEAVLQCSGNGRAFFPHEMTGRRGPDWGVGGVGNVIWTGTPVAAVVEALGGSAVDDAAFLTATGGEPLPPSGDRGEEVVERSVPFGKAVRDCLLAWELNGAPIPHEHGGPLRLAVPGYYGVNSVKWLARVAVTATETRARIQRSSYRLRPVGVPGSPDHPTMWSMPLKSFVARPAGAAPLEAGPIDVEGVAFSGEHPVAGVDVSVDGGGSWSPAELVGVPSSPYGWWRFRLRVDLAPGRHLLCSRAVDVTGARQPRERTANERGYGNTSWADHAVAVEAR